MGSVEIKKQKKNDVCLCMCVCACGFVTQCDESQLSGN